MPLPRRTSHGNKAPGYWDFDDFRKFCILSSLKAFPAPEIYQGTPLEWAFLKPCPPKCSPEWHCPI